MEIALEFVAETQSGLLMQDKNYQILLQRRASSSYDCTKFSGEFMDYDNHKQIVGMVKAIGFDKVHEVAFGADLVVNEYKNY